MNFIFMWTLIEMVGAAQVWVSYERILNSSAAESENWLTYSGDYSGRRHSLLRQITRQNVRQLRPAWIYQRQKIAPIKASPLVVDGLMYITEPPATVTALDLRTGRVVWRYEHTVPSTNLVAWPNRGVAVGQDIVIFGAYDAHLIAVDANTGRLRWKQAVADWRQGYAISSAPLLVKDKVLIGATGGETGIRGFVDAYYLKTGRRAWRFWTVPGPGEPGHESWSGDSWRTGGAPAWVTGSFDPDLNLVFWGTGNPAPPFDGSKRSGDNLFSNSLLALDADSGKLKWYFQFTPHDVWDWDSCHVPVLFDDLWQGHKRKLVAIANKNAYFYVLDRQTGRFHSATPFAPQSWTTGLDNNGRPRIVREAIPTNQWTSVEPSFVGATSWYSPAYSPQTGYFYVLVREVGGIVKKIGSEFVPGQAYWGGAASLQTGGTSLTAIRAMNTQTGQRQWEFRLHSTSSSGLLSTAGGLVFGGGTDGNFFALDAENGKPLWNFQTGGEINGNPVSYAINGSQFVVTAAGNCLITFGL